MQYYEIVKFYQKDGQRPRIQRGYGRLTIDQARRICQDPESSSKTASTACKGQDNLIASWHDKQKHWFLSFSAI